MTQPITSADKSIDFSESIKNLRKKASKSRSRARISSLFLVISIYAIVSFLLISLLTGLTQRYFILEEPIFNWSSDHYSVQNDMHDLEQHFVLEVSKLMQEITHLRFSDSNLTPTPEIEISTMRQELLDSINLLERMVDITNSRFLGYNLPSDNQPLYARIATNTILSIGVIGIIIFAINICISFVRYHTQLAELYESQADALKASGGSPEIAYQFVDKLSSAAVPIGNVPASLYEKALDAARENVSRISGSS